MEENICIKRKSLLRENQSNEHTIFYPTYAYFQI
jgi:hypothetical protein